MREKIENIISKTLNLFNRTPDTEIRISFKHDGVNEFQVPLIMIVRIWNDDPDDPNEVTFARVIWSS